MFNYILILNHDYINKWNTFLSLSMIIIVILEIAYELGLKIKTIIFLHKVI